jgi:hypothetical protein
MISLKILQEVLEALPTTLAKELPRHPPYSEEDTVFHPQEEIKELLTDPHVCEGGSKISPGIYMEIYVYNKHYSLYLGFTREGKLVDCFDAINGSY